MFAGDADRIGGQRELNVDMGNQRRRAPRSGAIIDAQAQRQPPRGDDFVLPGKAGVFLTGTFASKANGDSGKNGPRL